MENWGFILEDYWMYSHGQLGIYLSGNLTCSLERGKGLLAQTAIATNIEPAVFKDNSKTPNYLFVRTRICLLVPFTSLL